MFMKFNYYILENKEWLESLDINKTGVLFGQTEQKIPNVIIPDAIDSMGNDTLNVTAGESISGTANEPASAANDIEMTEITKGIPVYVKTSQLRTFENLHHKPRELARSLLKELIKVDELKQMTALGRSGKKGVPEEIRRAIFCNNEINNK
ncbi:uncharacterized protein LOC127291336 [Leptopilina boulardi]|uniref:uncharacterized protein LOC127277881 n=1 Tax=Leptopilina boulardi TaxID=63433 RepID=UPI0021F5919A|nr:uncharacterized protein LOC127277881 [Leptopilina boulardi]XP_051176366.1 uncharacterized protein LOC127291336 [Leptopilina boulardi]